MQNYYKILDVQTDATTAEIKSAYRRLARKKHPDLNNGDERLSREFTSIAKAYKILSDPQRRAAYDRSRLRAEFSRSNSFYDAESRHASHAKQMMYERRYNAIIDRMIQEERNESLALQKFIFPIVALFISTGFVAIFKPLFWSNSTMLGKIILLTLFIIGVLHFLKRIHAGLERYTYSSINIHDSLLAEIEEDPRRYSRLQAIMFLMIGTIISLAVGLAIGSFLGMMTNAMMPSVFSKSLHLEFMVYPPIVILVVDLMHAFTARFNY